MKTENKTRRKIENGATKNESRRGQKWESGPDRLFWCAQSHHIFFAFLSLFSQVVKFLLSEAFGGLGVFPWGLGAGPQLIHNYSVPF